MIGAPFCSAMVCSLTILEACAPDSEPPNTVKSFEKTYTSRPLIVPQPVTTPSPGTFCSAMPKSLQRCSTNMSVSSKESSSSRTSIRSRAVSLPLACWACDALLPAAEARLFASAFELLEDVLHSGPFAA